MLPALAPKCIVTHNAFDLPALPGKVKLVGRVGQAMEGFSTCGVDLLLVGHFRTSHVRDTSCRNDLPGYAALALQAGTATSTQEAGKAKGHGTPTS
jgi:hypothetical protein